MSGYYVKPYPLLAFFYHIFSLQCFFVQFCANLEFFPFLDVHVTLKIRDYVSYDKHFLCPSSIPTFYGKRTYKQFWSFLVWSIIWVFGFVYLINFIEFWSPSLGIKRILIHLLGAFSIYAKYSRSLLGISISFLTLIALNILYR